MLHHVNSIHSNAFVFRQFCPKIRLTFSKMGEIKFPFCRTLSDWIWSVFDSSINNNFVCLNRFRQLDGIVVFDVFSICWHFLFLFRKIRIVMRVVFLRQKTQNSISIYWNHAEDDVADTGWIHHIIHIVLLSEFREIHNSLVFDLASFIHEESLIASSPMRAHRHFIVFDYVELLMFVSDLQIHTLSFQPLDGILLVEITSICHLFVQKFQVNIK